MTVIPVLGVVRRLFIEKDGKNMTVIKFTEVGKVNARHKITESVFIINLINFE